MKNLSNAFLKPIEQAVSAAINKATSIIETIRLLGEISRDVKELRKDVTDIKGYLARQEEIARVMIEQGDFGDAADELLLTVDDDDIDDKDMN